MHESAAARSFLRMTNLRSRSVAVGLIASAAVLLVPALVFAWGDVGHRLTGEAAAVEMPPSTPAFFRNASRQLSYLNPEPDRWRDRVESAIDPALDRGTSPDHFIDMEMVSPSVLAAALKAKDRFGYLDTLAAAGVKGSVMGLLPFEMLELAQKLRVDFRNWRAAPDSIKPWIEARIIDDAGVLGHYVADGSESGAHDHSIQWLDGGESERLRDRQSVSRSIRVGIRRREHQARRSHVADGYGGARAPRFPLGDHRVSAAEQRTGRAAIQDR